jgi:hypothetical protein
MKKKIQLKKIAKMTVIASPNYDQIRVHNAQRESWFPVMGRLPPLLFSGFGSMQVGLLG